MLTPRRADDRGLANLGWLDSRHTFSFGHYHDPRHMGFGVLRVINEDRVRPGRGFDTHGHRDMEIISYVLDGALEHRDSLGNGSLIRPGDVQRMSAGTGVRHSEYNASSTDAVHFLQIWVLPRAMGMSPGYEQKHFPDDEKRGRLRLVAAADGRDGAVTLHQELDLYASLLAPGETVTHTVGAGRQAWIQVARGSVTVNGEALDAGDGLAATEPGALAIQAMGATGAAELAEVLVFDMAAADRAGRS